MTALLQHAKAKKKPKRANSISGSESLSQFVGQDGMRIGIMIVPTWDNLSAFLGLQ
jgi:hypothetical protein